jgi:hypothetical protein
MKMPRFAIYLMTPFMIFTSCHCCKKIAVQTPVVQEISQQSGIQQNVTPPALVYKTRKDYSQYVPVIMNVEKTKIISYPDPADVYYKGALAYPTQLKNGYLLDNRGIGPNVAFLNYTYETYSQLKNSLSMEQMMNNLLDKDPLYELWNCGSRASFKNEVDELNLLIDKRFPNCNQLVKELKVQLRQ